MCYVPCKFWSHERPQEVIRSPGDRDAGSWEPLWEYQELHSCPLQEQGLGTEQCLQPLLLLSLLVVPRRWPWSLVSPQARIRQRPCLLKWSGSRQPCDGRAVKSIWFSVLFPVESRLNCAHRLGTMNALALPNENFLHQWSPAVSCYRQRKFTGTYGEHAKGSTPNQQEMKRKKKNHIEQKSWEPRKVSSGGYYTS